VNVAFTDREYNKILNLSDIVYADGMSVVWASLFLGRPLPERVNVFDFSEKIFKKITEKDIKLYFLGGREAVVRRAVENLRKEFFSINVLGFRNGYFTDLEGKEIIKEINALRPNILIVGMGIPKQEKWVFKHLDELEVNLCWIAGGIFDNLSGSIRTAPRWMGQIGLEWLHRLCQDPRRLWRRYLIGNSLFIYRVLEYKVRSLFFR
jgi:N-acetylglucosaminyldiphosphoundecaprenol N-acetyl-beta-D-mannosaminyltransferase